MTAVLAASGLGKQYGRRWALSDCTLDIPPGRVVGLVGPNGAGKTTLLHLAVGLLRPTAGTIEVLGQPPTDDAGQLGRVGFVAQDTPVYVVGQDGVISYGGGRFGILFSPAGDGRMTLGGVGLCPNRFPAQAGAVPGGPPSAAFSQAARECVTRLVRQVLTYQPTSRYWPLQAYELAIFAGLALVLAGFCFWWVRRRFA